MKLIEKFNYEEYLEKHKSLPELIVEKLKIYQDYYLFIKDTLDEIYPEHWEVYLDEAVNFCLVIKFDELEITNSRKEKHVILDLFVCINLTVCFHYQIKNEIGQNTGKSDYTIPSYVLNFYGMRTTVTKDEHDMRYCHSHLNHDLIFEFSTFCLGTGTLATMKMSYAIQLFDIGQFTLLMYALDAFVRWESIEGVPYKNMKDIGIRTNRIPSLHFYAEHNYGSLNLVRFALEKGDYDVDVILDDDNIIVESNSSLDKAIIYPEKNSTVYRFSDNELANVQYMRVNSEGNLEPYSFEGNAFSPSQEYTGTVIRFRGKDYKYVIKKKEKEEKVPDLFLNPSFKARTLELMGKELERYLIRNNVIKILKNGSK